MADIKKARLICSINRARILTTPFRGEEVRRYASDTSHHTMILAGQIQYRFLEVIFLKFLEEILWLSRLWTGKNLTT
jgi:hypothetical protein